MLAEAQPKPNSSPDAHVCCRFCCKSTGSDSPITGPFMIRQCLSGCRRCEARSGSGPESRCPTSCHAACEKPQRSASEDPLACTAHTHCPHIGTTRERNQAHDGGFSEGFLWHSSCQDNRISHKQQVHVSAAMARTTGFFGWTGPCAAIRQSIQSLVEPRFILLVVFKHIVEQVLCSGDALDVRIEQQGL